MDDLISLGRARRTLGLALVLALSLGACQPAPAVSPTSGSAPTRAASPTTSPTLAPTRAALPAAPILLGDYALLAPEDMRFDLAELFHRIESTHPDPYAVRSEAEVEAERERLDAALAQPATMISFYRQAAPLVASLGGTHTFVSLPDDIMSAIADSELFFPLEVALEGQRAFVTANYSGSPDLPAGAELLAINGVPLDGLAGDITALGLRRYPFWWALWLLYGSVPEYAVEAVVPGAAAPAAFTLAGLTSQEINHRAPASPDPVFVAYRTLPGEAIGVLTIDAFAGIGPLLKPALAQAQRDQVRHLIIDLRANGGGYDDDVDALMDYLTAEPYRQCARKYQAPFHGYGEGAMRELGCGLIQPFDAAERFEGELYLLIGPETLSAAITLATILQDYNLALLIGEETGEAASYCADVPSELSTLPRTGLRYQCPRTCFVRPSGLRDDRGVIPDVVVETTVADQLAGRDPVLAYALDLIRSGGQAR